MYKKSEIKAKNKSERFVLNSRLFVMSRIATKMIPILSIFIAVGAYAATETIKWYANGSEYDTSTCESGGNVTIPSTAPTKRGHTFNGWVVALYDFSTLDYNISTTWDATHSRWKPINGSSGYLMQSEFGTENSSDLSNGEWADTFSYGTVIGNALCSDTDDGKTIAQTGNPGNATTGQYCWCMATGYQPNGSDVVYSPNSPLSWVFYNASGSASNCAYYCAFYCAYYVRYYSDFRRAVFGGSGA